MEHRIDDLLSESLIRPAQAHRERLPEPVAEQPKDEQANDQEMDTKQSVAAPMAVAKDNKDKETPHAAASLGMQSHGLKVINPIAPIVSAKERYAKELADINRGPGSARQTSAAPATPLAQSKSAVAPETKVVRPLAPVAVSTPASEPARKPLMYSNEPVPIVKHDTGMLPATAPTANEDEVTLPQPESLAVNDVARQRAEHEVQAKLHPVASQVLARPATARTPLAMQISRHQQRRQSQRPAERVVSSEEAAHNTPTPAQAQSASMTGQLIMPTGQKPKPKSPMPVQSKPKKLAPGEVFVDAQGNVMVGE
jgi:hypothetical protein